MGDNFAFLLGQNMKMLDDEEEEVISSGRNDKVGSHDLQQALREKDQTIARLREQNAKLLTDLDRAIGQVREKEEEAQRREHDLRGQIEYYKGKCIQDGNLQEMDDLK